MNALPICPILSAASAAGKDPWVSAPGTKLTGTFIPCLGTQCMFFHQVQMTNPETKQLETAGHCAVTRLPDAIYTAGNVLSKIALELKESNALAAQRLALEEDADAIEEVKS